MPLVIDANTISAVEKILHRGNVAEIKLVHGKIEVIEIKRKLIIKASATG